MTAPDTWQTEAFSCFHPRRAHLTITWLDWLTHSLTNWLTDTRSYNHGLEHSTDDKQKENRLPMRCEERKRSNRHMAQFVANTRHTPKSQFVAMVRASHTALNHWNPSTNFKGQKQLLKRNKKYCKTQTRRSSVPNGAVATAERGPEPVKTQGIHPIQSRFRGDDWLPLISLMPLLHNTVPGLLSLTWLTLFLSKHNLFLYSMCLYTPTLTHEPCRTWSGNSDLGAVVWCSIWTFSPGTNVWTSLTDHSVFLISRAKPECIAITVKYAGKLLWWDSAWLGTSADLTFEHRLTLLDTCWNRVVEISSHHVVLAGSVSYKDINAGECWLTRRRNDIMHGLLDGAVWTQERWTFNFL